MEDKIDFENASNDAIEMCKRAIERYILDNPQVCEKCGKMESRDNIFIKDKKGRRLCPDCEYLVVRF